MFQDLALPALCPHLLPTSIHNTRNSVGLGKELVGPVFVRGCSWCCAIHPCSVDTRLSAAKAAVHVCSHYIFSCKVCFAYYRLVLQSDTKAGNNMREIRVAKLVLNICVGESGDRLQKAAKVSVLGSKQLWISTILVCGPSTSAR